MLVMGIILFFSTLIKNSIMLLIIGIMIGYITSPIKNREKKKNEPYKQLKINRGQTCKTC